MTALGGAVTAMTARASSRKPNIIIIFADDLGYGDIGCFGSSIPTPNLDRMAKEGVQLTRFYSASPVCSPSRAALLSGRYPARTGVVNVLMPNASTGLNGTEFTIPKLLKSEGYRTACIGKWHLGTKPDCMPDRHGFDEFFGVPYSNDMFPLPMLKGSQVVDGSPAQTLLTARFTEQAVDFIGRHRDSPFFLYLAHTAPHIPLVPAERFRGKSGQGPYGDVVMELDWSTGQVLDALKQNGIDEHTLVIFTSDNGPWYQGSSGRLRGRKGTTYEGGVRVPFLARHPGTIPEGTVCEGVSSALDVLPTVARFGGAKIAAGATDGIDLWPLLTGEAASVEREALLFFDGWHIQCVRWGPWKLHLSRYNTPPWITADPPGGRRNLPLPNPELYNIDDDPGEGYDRAPEKPELVADLRRRVEQMLLRMPDQVRAAWRDTQAERIEGTPVGAHPNRASN
jgi:arylsulfatase A-like enzyme